MAQLSQLSPQDQLQKLANDLIANRATLEVYENYFSGAIPFPITEAHYQAVYRRIARQARPKWAKLIILAAAQRLAVEGFLTSDRDEPDDELWARFRDTGLDLAQHEIHVEAVLHGRSYAMAWPDATTGQVRVTPESPWEVMHWRSPDRTQTIALKMWDEGDTFRARLFTQDAVYAWAADHPAVNYDPVIDAGPRAARGERLPPESYVSAFNVSTWKQDGPTLPNPFAPALPIVPFVAGARMSDTLGRSDIESALDIIDRLQVLQMDLLLVSKIMGFPIRWASGVEVPVDADNKPLDQPFTTRMERFLMSDSPDAKFGQLPAADLRQINSVVSSVVTELAATTETPSSVLATANLANPVSAEALRAQEIPLVHRVRRHQRSFGPAWIQVARLLSGNPMEDVEVLWADAEVHSEAALTDALVKQVVSLGVPREAAWENLPNTTPATVDRWRGMRAAQMIEDRLAASLLAQPSPAPDVAAAAAGPESPSAEQLANEAVPDG